MKKIIFVVFLIFFLNSCIFFNDEEKTKTKNNLNKISEICKNPYKITQKSKQNLKLKGVVMAQDTKNINSSISGTIKYLNCQSGKKVYPKTLIAKIIPDYNNPNIKTLNTQKIDLNTQKINLISQISNLKNSRISQANSFDIQISNVDSQIKSVKSQIEIVKKNIENIKKTGKINIKDIDSQIKSLESQIKILKQNIINTKNSGKVSSLDLDNQIKSLQDSIKKLVNSKEILQKQEKEELEKLDVSKKNLVITIKNNIKDSLKKIDETFGITRENRKLNDKYEDYLSAKNRSLKNSVFKKFFVLNSKKNNFDKMSDYEIKEYLKEIIDFNILAANSVNASIDNVYFSKNTIDSLYKMFVNYSNSLASLKTNFDNFSESKKVLKTNFENQINSLEQNIESSRNSLENLEKNKKKSIGVNTDIQLGNLTSQLKTLEINLANLKQNKKDAAKIGTNTQVLNLESQLENLESNLNTLYTNKKNLIQNKKISLSSLDNQIIQLENSIIGLKSNLSSINNSLSPLLIYAGISGVIKQKTASVGNNVAPGALLCQIIPEKKSQKIKIYSPVELNIGDKLIFSKDEKDYEIIIENALVYKDAKTQNYVYESNYLDKNYFKDGEIVSLKFEENSGHPQGDPLQKNKIKNIPVSYIKNKIDGNYLKVKTGSGIIEKKVELGDINGGFVEVKNLENNILEICK